MKGRKPDGADLINARLAGIDQAAGDLEVRFGVAPVEDITALEDPQCECGDEESERQCNCRYFARGNGRIRTR